MMPLKYIDLMYLLAILQKQIQRFRLKRNLLHNISEIPQLNGITVAINSPVYSYVAEQTISVEQWVLFSATSMRHGHVNWFVDTDSEHLPNRCTVHLISFPSIVWAVSDPIQMLTQTVVFIVTKEAASYTGSLSVLRPRSFLSLSKGGRMLEGKGGTFC